MRQAEINRLEDEWPDARNTQNVAVILSLRGSADIPSATFLKAYERACLQLREQGVHLTLCGVGMPMHAHLQRSGILDVLGTESVFVETPRLMESVTHA